MEEYFGRPILATTWFGLARATGSRSVPGAFCGSSSSRSMVGDVDGAATRTTIAWALTHT